MSSSLICSTSTKKLLISTIILIITGIAFKIFKCNNYPELEGETVDSSLISNSQEIIEYFKDESTNKKLLLIL